VHTPSPDVRALGGWLKAYHPPMEGWDAFARAEPDMAQTARGLLHQRGDGEGFLATVNKHGTPRIHLLNVGIKDGRLLVFIQDRSAKARDLENNPRYALHAHVDPSQPHEFTVRGVAHLVTDSAVRHAAASDWFFRVSETYPLYELQIQHVLLGERPSPNDWPPRYRSWRSAGSG
jgi:Pyridoxamine 5'-phosphate oxidase